MLIFLAVGAAIGFAGGLFAIGGALVAIPVLVLVFGLSQHDAQGTAIPMAIAGALVTLTIYARKGLLSLRDALLMTCCSAVIGVAAAQAVRFVPDGALQRGFGAFLLLLAIALWFGHLGERDENLPISTLGQTLIGALAGVLSGFFVIGGALVCVPVLERVARYSQQRAQATALLMLTPTSALAFLSYAASGYVRWPQAIPLAIGAVVLAPAGTRVAVALPSGVLRRLFALLQAGAGALLLFGH
jgi:uncharacterized protein